MEFDILGPKGNWKFISVKGVEMDKMAADTFPNKFSAKKLPAQRTDIEIVAEYSGPSFIDQFGNKIPANTPYRFEFKKFFQPIDFTVKFYAPNELNKLLITSVDTLSKPEPFKIERVNKLDYAWWGGIKMGDKQYLQFLTEAQGTADLEAGSYELGVTWDDAVRVYLDDQLVIEGTPSGSMSGDSPHKEVKLEVSSGIHKFKVVHVESGGFARLSLKLKKL
jgi:hypothetical protein